MKKNHMIAFVFAVLFASVVGVGVTVAQPAPPPSWVGTPPAPLTIDETHAVNLASIYGTSERILANATVKANDLTSMGISFPQWAGGEPEALRLIVTRGSYSVPVLTNDGTSKQMDGTIVLQVIDEATGVPTVSIVASGDEASQLLQRIQTWNVAR